MICDKLMEIRVQNNLNKREMANKLEIPYTTYNNYETGAREPGSIFLKKFSQMFGCSIDYLMGAELEQAGFEKKEDAVADIFLRLRQDSTFYDAVQKLYNINDAQLTAVITMLSSFEKN